MKKKSTFAMFCSIAITCFLLSCSNEINIEKENGKIQKAKVITDLEKVNQELLSTVNTVSRGPHGWSKKEKLEVVCADLAGAWKGGKMGLRFGSKVGLGIGSPHLVGGGFAALGALIGGAWSSWKKAPTRASINNYDDFEKIQDACKILVTKDFFINENTIILKNEDANKKINIASEIVRKSRLDEKSLRIAKMHNIILSTLDGSITLDREKQSNPEEDKLKYLILNSKEFIDSCKVVGFEAQQKLSNTSNDITTKIISLFNNIVEEYGTKTDDIAFIIGKYMEVIENTTELTNGQKQSIKYGLATGLYSSNYWENRYNERGK